MACDNCDRLRREVRELKEELAEWQAGSSFEAENTTEVDLIRAKFRVRPQTAKIISALLSRPGKVVSHDLLVQAASCGGAVDGDKYPSRTGPLAVLRIAVAQARKAITFRNTIINVKERGYMIPVEKADALNAVLYGRTEHLPGVGV